MVVTLVSKHFLVRLLIKLSLTCKYRDCVLHNKWLCTWYAHIDDWHWMHHQWKSKQNDFFHLIFTFIQWIKAKIITGRQDNLVFEQHITKIINFRHCSSFSHIFLRPTYELIKFCPKIALSYTLHRLHLLLTPSITQSNHSCSIWVCWKPDKTI